MYFWYMVDDAPFFHIHDEVRLLNSQLGASHIPRISKYFSYKIEDLYSNLQGKKIN